MTRTITAALLTLALAAAITARAESRTQNFDSAPATNWQTQLPPNNGSLGFTAGFSATELASDETAGDQSGEARVKCGRGGTGSAFYADTRIGLFDIGLPWTATGRFDIVSTPPDDLGTGIYLGYFDQSTGNDISGDAPSTITAFGLCLYEAPARELRLRAIYRTGGVNQVLETSPAYGNSPFSTSDRTFSLSWDPTGGAGPGDGRLSCTVTDVGTGTAETNTLDLAINTLGAVSLNAFGLFKPAASGSTPPADYIDWRMDSLAYTVSTNVYTPPPAVTNLSNLYASADEWVNAATLDRIPAHQVTLHNIYVPQSAAEWTYNHTPTVVEFNGTLFAAWYNGWKDEHDQQSRLAYAVSTNGGMSWSEMRIAVDDPDGTGPEARINGGFWIRDGELYLLGQHFKFWPDGSHTDQSTHLYRWNASTEAFDYVEQLGQDGWWAHGNPVEQLADGRYMIPMHHAGGTKACMIGGVDSPTNFVQHTLAAGGFSEHSGYQLPDGTLVFYFREYSAAKRLYRASIQPDGAGLQGPVVTDCPDAPAKQHASRWPGGNYYIVGNLDTANGRSYLVYTESEDGLTFTRGRVLDVNGEAPSFAGRWKDAGIQYPSSALIEGKLYVVCSRAKEDIRLYIYDPSAVPLIDVVFNADDPDTAPTEPTEAATAVFTDLRTIDSPVASNTTNDLAHGITPVILTGSPHALSDGIGVLTDGGVGPDGTSVGSGSGKFFFDNAASAFRFRLSLPAAASIGAIRSYSWHKNSDSDSRAHQQYRLYASDGTAPGFNQDDPASAGWTDLGYLYSRAVLGNTDGQVATEIRGTFGGALGTYRHFVFEVEPANPTDDSNHTFYNEIDIIPASGPVDADADGIPDDWENEYGGTNLFWTGGDWDGDGLEDQAERTAGTVPTNALSVFKILSVSKMPSATLVFPGVSGRTYRAMWSTNLLGTNWWLLAGTSVTVTADGEITIQDTSAPTPQRFYRLTVE